MLCMFKYNHKEQVVHTAKAKVDSKLIHKSQQFNQGRYSKMDNQFG